MVRENELVHSFRYIDTDQSAVDPQYGHVLAVHLRGKCPLVRHGDAHRPGFPRIDFSGERSVLLPNKVRGHGDVVSKCPQRLQGYAGDLHRRNHGHVLRQLDPQEPLLPLFGDRKEEVVISVGPRVFSAGEGVLDAVDVDGRPMAPHLRNGHLHEVQIPA